MGLWFSTAERGMTKRNRSQRGIWIDLENSPHVPFFRPIIDELKRREYTVEVSARDCFQVSGLAERSGLPHKMIGRHYGKNKIMKVLGFFVRTMQLLPLSIKWNPSLALSHGSRSQLLASKILGIPSVVIMDYEYGRGAPFSKPDWLIIPEVIPEEAFQYRSRHIRRYPGIKEDVYVSRFKPDSSILNDLKITGEEVLIVVRPPADEAHYHDCKSDELFRATMDWLALQPAIRVVLLPRTASQEALIRKHWAKLFVSGKLLVPDRVVDGLNLIWHSDLVISGGGTMNREAAALGVPVYSIFGGRMGAVDRYLADTGRLVLLQSVEDVRAKITVSHRDRSVSRGCFDGLALKTIVDTIESIVSV